MCIVPKEWFLLYCNYETHLYIRARTHPDPIGVIFLLHTGINVSGTVVVPIGNI